MQHPLSLFIIVIPVVKTAKLDCNRHVFQQVSTPEATQRNLSHWLKLLDPLVK